MVACFRNRALVGVFGACFVFAMAELGHAQTFSKPFRKTSVAFFETGAQQQWDPWDSPTPDAQDSDQETNRALGFWRSDLEFNNPNSFPFNPANIWTAASQDSDIDEASGTFWCYGYALASIYVQGDAASDAASRFRFDFELDSAGQLILEGNVGVATFFGRDQSRDRSGKAKVVVRVVNRATGATEFRKVIQMNAVDQSRFINDFEFEGDPTGLEAGTSRLIVNATANDVAVYDQVEFSLANAYVELEGRIEP